MPGQHGKSEANKAGLERSTFTLSKNGQPIPIRWFGERRHAKQRAKIEQAALPLTETIKLLAKYERVIYLAADNTPKYCCLFNVIVAFAWQPSTSDLEQLRDACDSAAQILFDVTDGSMSFNSFIIGGPELLDCADIQIFPSNRLYPRAWVNGLHIELKYQPIRIGRGYWRKSQRAADPWDKELSVKVLVHEWLHYAGGLKDAYVEQEDHQDQQYALPHASAATQTLMANLEETELVQHPEWEALAANSIFDWLDIVAEQHPVGPAPSEHPTPIFDLVGSATAHRRLTSEALLRWDTAGLSGQIDPDHCWAFVVIGDLSNPTQLIAQGSFENLLHKYRIIDVRDGDGLLLVGHAPDDPGTPKVVYATVAIQHGSILARDRQWLDVTPNPQSIPLVAVAIGHQQISAPYDLSVHIAHPQRDQWQATLFPLGAAQGTGIGNSPTSVDLLDGHVLLYSGVGRQQVAIANYSIGGSPGAAYPGGPNPVPAGSSDGNAMIFFYDQQATTWYDAPENGQHPASSLRIITTTNILIPNSSIEQGARSYAFALVPNATLTDAIMPYYPTLVLYYDRLAIPSEHTYAIYRRGSNGWIPIPGDQQFEDPERALVAAQINHHTAPGLFAAEPSPEYYCLFLT